MKQSQVKKLKPFALLCYWITQRESIRVNRNLGRAKPWTADPILQSYRFCNIQRMDDRVSQWLLNNWYNPHLDDRNMLVACCLARFINLPTTLEAIGFPSNWEPNRIMKIVRDRQKRGIKVYNPAYMIRGNVGKDKIETIVKYTIDPVFESNIQIHKGSMEETWKKLRGFSGFGSFMAGQVVADLRYAACGSWRDKNTWAPIGPGSHRGMNRLLKRDISEPMKQDEFLDRLLALIEKLKKALPKQVQFHRLEAMDVQNCLCEYDKYCRTLNGEGRPKHNYPGT